MKDEYFTIPILFFTKMKNTKIFSKQTQITCFTTDNP